MNIMSSMNLIALTISLDHKLSIKIGSFDNWWLSGHYNHSSMLFQLHNNDDQTTNDVRRL